MPTRIRTTRDGLAYRRAGSGKPVLLVHGIPGSAATWDRVLEHLPGDVEAIVVDLLGFGESARPPAWPDLCADAQAAALARLLDDLAVGPAAVVGHDYGGPVALTLAGTHPGAVSAVGLLATNTFPDTPIPFPLSLVTVQVLGAFAERLLFSGPSLRMMLRQGTGHGGAAPDAAASLGDERQRAAVATIFAHSLRELGPRYAPVERHLRTLDVPVFVGWGERDPFFPLSQGERTAEAARTTLRRYAGAGHFLPDERPAEVAADIAALTLAVTA